MDTSSPETQLLDNPAQSQSQRQQSAGQREAPAARRGSRVPAGGVVMGRGRGWALAAVLTVMVCGWLAARADAFVYWTNADTSLGRANLDGTGVNQNLFGVGLGLYGVAADGQHVLWTNFESGAIGRANPDGSGADQSFITGASAPLGVAVDAQHIYWANSSRGTIGRANLDGSGVDQNFVTGVGVPSGVAVDGQHIYWSYGDSIYGGIGRANLDGSGVDQSFITSAGLLGVADDGQHIYWVDDTFDTIARANLDGSGLDEAFVTGAEQPDAVAVDSLPLPPRASITTPGVGATYTVGQAVDSSFTCSEGTGGPGIASCLDQSGQSSGAAIDTSTIGLHTFTVTATSNDGQTGSESSAYTVLAPSPVLGDLKGSHSRWREGPAVARITSRTNRTPRPLAVGTTFSFTLSQPATVTLTFTRQASGRAVKVNGRSECVVQTKRNQHPRKCILAITAATLSLTAPSGTDKILFAGRVSPTHKLGFGSYTATITATNAIGESSAPKSLRFTIVK
jgi:hypothetical protein